METLLKHGATLVSASPKEVQDIIRREIAHGALSRDTAKRVRASQTGKIAADGSAQIEVYGPPMGFQFEARRVFLDLDTASDPSTGNVALNVAGKSVEYLRSGIRQEYGVPMGPNAVSQVPGSQTWGDSQGPYFRNGEVFEVRVKGFPAGSNLTVYLEGIVSRPGPEGE